MNTHFDKFIIRETRGFSNAAREIYAQEYRKSLIEYGNMAFANQRAWTALGKAGYCKDDSDDSEIF